MVDDVEEFLAHHGVKGMHWGVITKDDPTGSGQAKAEAKTARRMAKAQKYHERAKLSKQTIDELDKLGMHSPEMQRLYGKATEQSDRMFLLAYGMPKEKALAKARSEQVSRQKIAEKDAVAKEHGKLSRGQKIGIGDGIGAVALVAAYGAYKYPDIVTRNAKAGESISLNNFFKRYGVRSETFSTGRLTKEAFHKLDDTDVKVPAGTIFKRMTAFPNEELNKRLYTTFTDADNDKYQGIYGPALRMRTGISKLHISEMEMGSDISSPSAKKRVQILIDMLDENNHMPHTGGGTGTAKEVFASMMRASAGDVNKLPAEDLALKHYNVFAREMVGNHPFANAYFDKVKSLGYNALVDDNDAKQLSDVPMILLDAANTVKSRTSKVLTPEMEKAAQKRFVELLDPISK